MNINYRNVMGSIVLVFTLLPLYSAADTSLAQPLVEQPGQDAKETERAMSAWVEPPAGPYRFFPPQPDYPPAGYPSGGQMPLPAQDSGYAYEYQDRQQPPATSMYNYGSNMPPPVRAYDYGNYPRNSYPSGMRPYYYPYGAVEQMPVQPYYW